MAVFKCKMCGGDLNACEGLTVCECEYCGTKQTVSCSDDEKRINLYNRANRLRINSEFDKAANIYESIVAEFPEEAEAYWGLVICNYGIEYVDDPATAKKIPTCHRASFDSIQNDENYQLALEYADISAQKIYRNEAREIDRIREEILAISKNESPYDIFICYKETDDKGERTIDSVIAQDIYDILTDKGYKVFFSRISLEDKLGCQYEPYIFAALNSAKVMLAFGTTYEYFHAVWVKNEWSRFLKLMAKDKTRVLIPCYKDMDAYEMPDEFKALQAQDLGKVGAVQDLVRGIGKILFNEESATRISKENTVSSNVNIAPLIERAFMFLEDGDFARADEFAEQVLNLDPKYAEAYLVKIMAECKIKEKSKLLEHGVKVINNYFFQKALKFAEGEFKDYLETLNATINEKVENEKFEEQYLQFEELISNGDIESLYKAKEMFGAISGYKDADSLVLKCDEMLENIYLSLLEQKQAAKTEADLSIVLRDFKKLGNYKDSAKIRKELAEKIISLSYAPIINKAKYKLKLAISPQEVDEALNMLQGFNGIPEVTQILKDKERYIEEAKERKIEYLMRERFKNGLCVYCGAKLSKITKKCTNCGKKAQYTSVYDNKF